MNTLDKKIIAIEYLFAMELISVEQKQKCIDYLTGKKKVLRLSPVSSINEGECIKRVIIKCESKKKG